jgi:ABC-type transport system involved in multi-copper enzyme maturation permease subunit
MRSYLAILKDSFREALASRVLWIVLILATIALVLTAPVGLKHQKTARLRRNSVRDWQALVTRIDEQRRSDAPSPGRQIWNRWSEPLKARLTRIEEESPGDISGDVAADILDEINNLLDDPTFYDQAAWQETEPGAEADELLRRGVSKLNGDEVARLNRLLLRAAYPAQIPNDETSEVSISYLGFRTDKPYPLTPQQTAVIVKSVLAGIVNTIVGTFGVLAAILVTAPIIPQTFEPGAVDLLMSKPVSRSLVFLTKVLGGCAFIALTAAYLIAGLWLIAGLRFDIWSNRLFLCVPVVVFLFAIYYSVSALAGVIWRNAIVSVVVTIIFWGVCFGVWVAKEFVEGWWITPERLVKLIPAGETLLAVSEDGKVQSWRARDSTWEEVFASDAGAPRPGGFALRFPMIGPVYDPQLDRIVAIQTPVGAGGMSLFGPAPTLLLGTRKEGWVQKKGPAPPAGALALFVSPRHETIVVTKGAVFSLPPLNAPPAPAASGKGKPKIKGEKFVRMGPEQSLRLDASAVAAMDSETGAIVTFSQGTLTALEPTDKGKYERRVEREIEGAKESSGAALAVGGKNVVLALRDGRVMIFDSDLAVRYESRPLGEKAPRVAAASPGGRWLAVLFQNRTLWMYDTHQSRPANFSLTGQGHISAMAFGGPDRLLAVDRGKRVTHYQLEPFRAEAVESPPLSTPERSYYYGLIPLYTLLPRQGELGDAVRYLLEDKDSESAEMMAMQEGRRGRRDVDVAGPLWSSLAFLTVVLTLSCVYVWRSDF